MKLRQIALVLALFWSVGGLAQFNAGLDESIKGYLDGLNGMDASKALEQVRLDAERGNVAAQFALGGMYAMGEGVPQDDREAMKWFRLAAEQGHATAQLSLSFYYASGEGVPQDYVKAYAWLNLAASQGLDDAKRNLDVLSNRMTPSQRSRARWRFCARWWRCAKAGRRKRTCRASVWCATRR